MNKHLKISMSSILLSIACSTITGCNTETRYIPVPPKPEVDTKPRPAIKPKPRDVPVIPILRPKIEGGEARDLTKMVITGDQLQNIWLPILAEKGRVLAGVDNSYKPRIHVNIKGGLKVRDVKPLIDIRQLPIKKIQVYLHYQGQMYCITRNNEGGWGDIGESCVFAPRNNHSWEDVVNLYGEYQLIEGKNFESVIPKVGKESFFKVYSYKLECVKGARVK